MSPEQARGQEIDSRADLYALGVVLYEILTGKLPYNGKDSLSTALAHLTEPLPELRRSNRAATRTSCASCWPRTRPSASQPPAR